MIKLIISNRTAHVVVAALAGALAGFVVYTISRVTGRNLYIIIGAVAAAAAAFVWQRYRRRVQLTGVKMTVPSESRSCVFSKLSLLGWLSLFSSLRVK